MREVVIASSVRTPVGKAYKGTLRATRPDELGAVAIRGALDRLPQLDPREIEDVIMGCAMPEAEQGMNVARIASLRAGLPVECSAMTVKFGCGIAQCGACTVHVNGEAIRSCSVPISTVEGKEITTIEGLSSGTLHPVQQAWLTEQVPQCGYCQSGQIMATVAYLKTNPNPTDADINENLTNICRCGTYERLRRAVHRAAALMRT